MRNPLLVPEILELLDEGRTGELIAVLEDMHPNDAASILSGLEEHRITEVMAQLPLALERDVFGYFEPDVQESIVLGSGRARVRQLLSAISSDDRAELLDRLDPRVREQMLPLLTRAVREDLLRRESYEEDQVGAILSTEFLVLGEELTAAEAIEEIRRQEPTKETIYYSFVTDGQGRLHGFVSLRKLIMARPNLRVAEIMNTNVVSALATDDREDAAQKVRDYDLLALPVTDQEGRLLGILTHDDAADVAEEEAEEDLEMMAGIAADDRPESYLEGTISGEFRRRVPVLTVLAVSSLAVSMVLVSFEQVTKISRVFVCLLPMVLASGGNVGNQTSTAVILGLRHDLTPKAILEVLWKEWRVSLLLALVLGTVAACQAFVLLGIVDRPTGHLTVEDLYPLRICAAVATAMVLHVMTGAVLGSVIPLAVAALRRDPTMVAHPALSTVADLSGATIYCTTILTLLPGVL